MASAAQRVFGTIELLEAIFLELELTDEGGIDHAILRAHAKTIIASQRVSRAFYQTVRGSSKLQQALCLRRKNSKVSVMRHGGYLLQSWPIWISPTRIKIGPVELQWTWRQSPFIRFYVKSFIKPPSLRCNLTVDATSCHSQYGSWRQLLVAPPDTAIERLWLSWEEDNQSFVFNIHSIDTKKLVNPTLGDLVELGERKVQDKKCHDLELKLGDGGKNIYHGFSDLNIADDW